MARPSNRVQRRGQSIAGLATVLAEVGSERATVVAIAEAAGLTPGLVHPHFGHATDLVRRMARGLIEGPR